MSKIEVITERVTDGHNGEIRDIQYTQSQMVGHGSFGVVFQTQILPTNEIAAIKRILQDKRFKNRELQIMKLVHHRNVVDMKYYFYKHNEKNELYLNLILEFVPETTALLCIQAFIYASFGGKALHLSNAQSSQLYPLAGYLS